MNHPSQTEIQRVRIIEHDLNVKETSQLLVELGALRFEPFHEPEAAITALERAVSLEPDSVDARFWLAKVYFHDHCDYEKASRILTEALERDPNRADCLCLLASAGRDTGEPAEKRLLLLQKASQLAPDWIMPHRLMADLFRESHNYVSVVNELTKALNLTQRFLGDPIPTPANEYYESAVTGRLVTSRSLEIMRADLKTAQDRLR